MAGAFTVAAFEAFTIDSVWGLPAVSRPCRTAKANGMALHSYPPSSPMMVLMSKRAGELQGSPCDTL